MRAEGANQYDGKPAGAPGKAGSARNHGSSLAFFFLAKTPQFLGGEEGQGSGRMFFFGASSLQRKTEQSGLCPDEVRP